MKRILICWIGFADVDAAKNDVPDILGPIGQAALSLAFDEINLISDFADERDALYLTWLKSRTKAGLLLHSVDLSGPTHFGEIYEAAVQVIKDAIKRHQGDLTLTFHLSPGTPAMAAVWIILGKTRFPATLIESSLQQGVKIASVPFDISAEFIPDLLRQPDERLEKLAVGLPPQTPVFESILHRSRVMKRVVTKAHYIAPRSVPVLIEGESGTGKELLARAIHGASPRRDRPFMAVNCGAISKDLVESELFGHEKGAFTGADKQRAGYFEAANTGTLFLDEIGELPPDAQVKLLRALQEKEIVRVGATSPVKIDVRIIAATNRNLIEEMSNERFRVDLFYRLAVAVLRIPPLRERSGDIGLLVDKLLDQINQESVGEPGYNYKKVSVAAKNLLLQHSWPGNVRELQNTLRRAAIWSTATVLDVEDLREAILPESFKEDVNLLNRPLGDGFNLIEITDKISRHYIARALKEAHGNKTKAAQLVGLPNYQTFSNWMKKYDVK